MTTLPINPFRFSLIGSATSPSQWRDLARRAEACGYSALLVPEHLDTPYSTLSLMSIALEATTTLRVGSHVLCNDLHNPTMLARDIATLDAFSHGRVELGIGAGNRPQDIALAGVPFYSAGQRIERLEASVQHIKELFSQQKGGGENPEGISHADTLAFPPVIQHPHPPIYIGGGGKKMLAVAARQANIIGITAKAGGAHGHLDLNDITPELLQAKIGWIREAAGERFSSLEFSMPLLGIALTEQHRQGFNWAARMFGFTVEQLEKSLLSVSGTVDSISDELYRRRELYGISYFTMGAINLERFAPIVERLSGK
ncbi:LLM class F420-dependent oxidoreductase [Dictyobacter alpinus]|uniref:LLM class F420-dependent oxidoreductase n=1 Tax=Dictyobacter alpinus TaxID=2014873 RepID=A0A402B9V6_9CHLR|nr:TIGR03621 family F420-dependent LLM class oxidoreductase [Dictyobacter alpinus]GCE28171.1 LLM class F420-dependent oxidoreductase [Dictyobacter alpinus]